MPNPVVYDWFIDHIPKATEVEFQETQGQVPVKKNLPELWCTVEFDAGSRQRLTIGRRAIWREYGTATVLFLIKAGVGPRNALQAAQRFADVMEQVLSVAIDEGGANAYTGTLRIENVSPANGEPYEDGNWLVTSVSCVYTYDSVRGAETDNPFLS